MLTVALLVVAAAAVLLFIGGYVLGVGRGERARASLELEVDALSQGRARLESRVAQLSQQQTLVQNTVHRVVSEVWSKANEQDESLRGLLRGLLAPLLARERVSAELAQLSTRRGNRNDLVPLLDQIADVCGFSAVLLGDDGGWPLAISSNAVDADHLVATSSAALLVLDRLEQGEHPPALAFMVADSAGEVILTRVFHVGGRRLSLSAVSGDAELSLRVLDPLLPKVENVLTNRDPFRRATDEQQKELR